MVRFGKVESEVFVPKREAAYGFLFNSQDEIAVVYTSRGYFLPGGGIEADESHAACLVREFQEELGYVVEVNDFLGSGTLIGYAPGKSKCLEMVGHNYLVTDTGRRTTKVEIDHELVWLSLQEARTKLRLTHQAWAIEDLINNRNAETLCAYNPHWKTWFETLESVFKISLGDEILAIEHVGSTAVEGVVAKPIIDVDLVMENYASFETIKQRLEGLGYVHCGDQEIFEREAFKRNPLSKHKMETTLNQNIELLDAIPHHLHVCTRKRLVDLHMHTTASDGTQTPEALMAEILHKRLALFSVTDHDSIENIDEIANLAKKNAVDFIPGVEISVSFEGKELHILTYGVSTEDDALGAILKRNQAIREAHNTALVAFACAKHNCVFDFDEYAHEATRGGWKALNYLMDKGIATSITDFFSLIEAFGTPLVFDPFDEVIPKLHALGYLLVLAHPPAYYGGRHLTIEMLDTLVSLGIQGIECYSPYYASPEDAGYYLEYCREKSLVMTSGSDYHGAFIPSRKLAVPVKTTMDVSYDRLKALIL